MSVAALAVIGSLLAGCSGGDDTGGGKEAPTPSSTASADAVNDKALGSALSKLVFQGTQKKSTNDDACLVAAVKKADISAEGLAHIVKTSGDDRGAVAASLSKVNSRDAQVLLSPQLREDFDACVDADLGGAGTPRDKAYRTPKPAKKPNKSKKANLKPKYKIKKNVKITSPTQLTDGLVSMFSSYAQDKKQKQIYKASGGCLADVVFEADFSEETLKFLAGGAPIGTGSVVDYLPKDEDKKIWKSQEFTSALVDCTTSVKQDPNNKGG